jgi:hypothetical protein
MLTPTTAELLNAIEVLNKLGERINTDATHSVMQMPESSLGEHYAGRIGVNAIEQTSRIQIVAEQLKDRTSLTPSQAKDMAQSALQRQAGVKSKHSRAHRCFV